MKILIIIKDVFIVFQKIILNKHLHIYRINNNLYYIYMKVETCII